MEIAFKIALQYWTNKGFQNKKKIATLKNGYHGDTGHVSRICTRIFSKFKNQLFTTLQFDVPNNTDYQRTPH